MARLPVGIVLLVVVCALRIAHAQDSGLIRQNDFLADPSAPELLYPRSETVDLTGKDSLEFRWLNNVARTDHFIFKIYSGYDMYGRDLVYAADVSSSNATIRVPADLFKNDHVYTWSVIRVSVGGRKSEKAFSSFTVVHT